MSGGEIFGNKAVDLGNNNTNGGGLYIHIYGPGFIKTGGIIYGSDGGVKANKVVDTDGSTLLNSRGHAIFAGSNEYRFRDTTVTEALGIQFEYSDPYNIISQSGNWDD